MMLMTGSLRMSRVRLGQHRLQLGKTSPENVEIPDTLQRNVAVRLYRDRLVEFRDVRKFQLEHVAVRQAVAAAGPQLHRIVSRGRIAALCRTGLHRCRITGRRCLLRAQCEHRGARENCQE